MTPTLEQVSIISAPANARLLVQAGPGTGKTEVVAHRLVHLLGPGGLEPGHIAVLSFSRSAVKTLTARIRTLGCASSDVLEDLRHLSIRTFDAWAFRALRQLGEDVGSLLRRGYEANIVDLGRRLKDLDDLASLKADGMGLARIRHVIVDEIQDMTGARAELVLTLLGVLSPPGTHECGFTLLGDMHQAIYGFSAKNAGSETTTPAFIKELKAIWEDSLEEKSLTQNHRCRDGIVALLDKARTILNSEATPLPALQRLLGESTSIDKNGLLIELQSDLSLAVLCRSNQQIAAIAADLEYAAHKSNVELKDVRLGIGTPPQALPTWLARMLWQFQGAELTRSLAEKLYRQESITYPATFVQTWQCLVRAAGRGSNATSVPMEELRRRIAWPDSLPDDEGEEDHRTILTTIHQSKGQEFERVRLMPDAWQHEDADLAEEGRLLFVGLSRARSDFARIAGDEGKCFFTEEEYRDKRKRWHRMLPRVYFHQFEMGCEGDLDEQSLVRTELMGGEDAVRKTQKLLSDKAQELIGQRVVLRKSFVQGGQARAVWRILLDDQSKGEECLGFTSQALASDLLSLRDSMNKKLKLPSMIYNLRIVAISSVACVGEMPEGIAMPWKSSRFWLVPVIHGIAGFKFAWK